MGRGRWNYMGQPDFNPPCDACPECQEPSKVYFVGGKTVNGMPQYRYQCEHGHTWKLSTMLPGNHR